MEFVTENDASEWACLFHRNGRFEINPKYTVDEAAKEFCRLVNAEHQRVVEELDNMTQVNDSLNEMGIKLQDERNRLVEENRRLREALLKYGWHRECNLACYPCDCGFNVLYEELKAALENLR